MRVLLVEDNTGLADGIARALGRAGFTVDVLADGTLADGALRAGPSPDLLILDLGLPGLDGIELLRRLRARGDHVPVLVLTARGAIGDRVAGLNLGADDYLTKPFDLAELSARAHALVRRAQGTAAPELRLGPLLLDPLGRSASVDGVPLELTRRELGVLETLANRAGRVVGKDAIAEQLFSYDEEAGPNAIELYVSRLRKKLAGSGLRIRTVRGLGYLLERPS